MNKYYRNQNDAVIAYTVDRHEFTGDTFWWKVDRQRRVITDEATKKIYEIPEWMDLT
jgi:hypothetical protein